MSVGRLEYYRSVCSGSTLRCGTTQLRERLFLQVTTNNCRITVDLKYEGPMECHRRGRTEIDPDTTAMCFQKIEAQQAAAQYSGDFGEEAAGMSKATVRTTSVNIVGS